MDVDSDVSSVVVYDEWMVYLVELDVDVIDL